MRKGCVALALSWGLCAWAGCSSCDGDKAVPFKRGTATQRGSFAPLADGGAATPGPVPPGSARPGSSYPAETRELELAGHALAVGGGVALRAGLDVDVDADGEPELLLVTQDPGGGLVLQVSRAKGERWTTPEPAAQLVAPGLCTLREAALTHLDAEYAVARADLDCGALARTPSGTGTGSGPGGVPPPDPPAPPGTPAAAPSAKPPAAAPASSPAVSTRPERRLWVVALEHPPRVVEHVAAPLSEATDTLRVEPAVQSRDLDADGHSDLVLALDVRGGGIPDARVDVQLLSRAGGLSHDSAEPEKTLLALADRAKAERKGNAGRAAETARQVLALHGALCRESGAALVRLGESQGLPCGASLAAGRAASVRTAALAAQGKLLEAVAGYEALRRPEYRLNDNDWERVHVAIAARSDSQGYEFRTGPAIAVPSAPAARRAMVAFLDEQRLLLRSEPPTSYDLASGEQTPIGMPGGVLITDPGGGFALGAITRSCEGYHLSIVDAARIVLGVVAGPSVSEPLIATAPAPPDAHCPLLSPEQRRDTGGFRALAWTPRGVLLARGPVLFMLAVDAAGHGAGPASELPKEAAITGLPPHSSELTPDGRFLAILTPLGIAIHDRQSDATRLIALPPGSEPVSDVAVSPSGKRIALVRGRRLLFATPRSPSPSPIPSPSSPSPSPSPSPPSPPQ